MISIKIQCGCGQKYAFDTEPIGGQMTSAIACPICGADGTSAANAAIAQSLVTAPRPIQAAPTMATPVATPSPASNGGTALRVSSATQNVSAAPATTTIASPAPTTTRPRHVSAHNLPQMDRKQAETEARAKISWGDAPDDVVKFLMLHGFTVAEARPMVNEMFNERAATIRKNGIGKIIKGSAAICVPIITFIIFLSIGMFFLKLLALTIMVGLWGAWQVLKGIFMVVSPKTEQGDVAEQ